MQKEIQIMIDYVEGRLSIDKFKLEFETNKDLINQLHKKINKYAYNCCNNNIYDYMVIRLKLVGWESIRAKACVWCELCEWLDENGVSYSKTFDKYVEDYKMLLDIQPSWLDISDDQGIFDNILKEIPKDLSKSKQIGWGKAKVKELFKYDKTYPRWVQGGEWPIVNGKPLVFSHQKKLGKDDERVHYFFYDPDTKEEVIVEQLY